MPALGFLQIDVAGFAEEGDGTLSLEFRVILSIGMPP
jgi:hypothetical protein